MILLPLEQTEKNDHHMVALLGLFFQCSTKLISSETFYGSTKELKTDLFKKAFKLWYFLGFSPLQI